jgi:hypothetical protein
MPMQNTRAVGSVKGYGFSSAAAAEVELGVYYGPEYSGFDLVGPITFNSSNIQSQYNSNVNTDDTLDGFIDRPRSRLYGGYNTASIYNLTASPSAIYSNNANFYTFSTRVDFAGQGPSNLASNGRGLTVAYLSNAARTPVICIGKTDATVAVFDISTNFLGTLDLNGTGITGSSDLRGLCWDGQHLCVGIPNTAVIYRYILPASVSGTQYPPLSSSHSAPHGTFYGMGWFGDSYVTSSDAGAGASMTQFREDPTSPGSHNTLRTFPIGSTTYGLKIDYKDRVLLAGSYSQRTYYAYKGN